MSKRSGTRDSGMSLVEVLISVLLTAMLCTALAFSVTVVLKQSDNTTGRVNNARSEQNVGFWMPSDLASADAVSTDPAAMPCDAPCPPEANTGGSNALMLTWSVQTLDTATGNTVTVTTKVSYRYMQAGDEWVMVRVECSTFGSQPASCSSRTMLHNLDGPPAGQAFVPGVSTPSWVIQVSQALDPASTGAPDETIPPDPTLKNKNGQRIVVTINGGGDFAGAGGGTNQISLSAGGTERKQNLATSDPSGVPPFIAARSRCGGNFALVVDVSGSIGATNMGSNISGTPNWSTVRGSVYKFIEAFEGTPVKLEVVKFSTSASTLGASGDAQMYYDMLDPAQVSALKALVGYPNTAGGLQSGGNTNWEDGFHSLLQKSDDSVQPILPKTVIFFTDGMPTNSRLQSATPTPTMDPTDAPLPGPNSTYYQVGWNRANRLMRQYDADVQSLVGMFVGDVTDTSPWVDTQGYHLANWQRGYHNVTERGNNVVFERGYHDDYQRGNKVIWERAYHDDYQRGNNVVWERGYHVNYERNNNIVFEYSTTGLTYERKSGGTWSSTTIANYFQNNSTPDETDNWRVRITGTLGPTWSSTNPYTGSAITQATYDKTNTSSASTDGFRTRVNGSLSGSWTTVTSAQYNGSNTTSDSTDGWRATNVYTSPFDTWESTTQATYDSSNTVAAETDGWRTRQTAASTSWVSVSSTAYNASNTTSDNSDGWQIVKTYSSPWTTWEATTQTTYASNNTVPAETDGWRTRQTSSSTSWTSVTVAEYNASNTTSDNSDGWQIAKAYSSPYNSWETTTSSSYYSGNSVPAETDGWRTRETSPSTSWISVTQSNYDESNLTSDSSDGWRTSVSYTSPYSFWEATTEALYTANNTTSDSSDGWKADKVYSEPFTGYEAMAPVNVLNKDILGRFIQPVGAPVEPITDGSGNVTNAATANLYTMSNYALLNSAMQAIALNECGGTLTIQTRLQSTGQSAVDPFTYQNSIDQKVVTTTSYFRGGTFDFQTTSSVNPTITLQTGSDLSHYTPVSWSCTAKGQPRSFTTTPIPGGPWQSITVNVAANEAVSCTQFVQWTP
ncbi:MAG TPA: vWA domain-containing protein [Ilumatobacteraceae bacterium]